MTALVLSAGGLFAAWEVGAWKALSKVLRPDLIIGTSAGAWNGWCVAGGASHEELAAAWLDPETARILRVRRPSELYTRARDLYARFQPKMPFALTLTQVPQMRPVLLRDKEIDWRHLAATASIPVYFPSMNIDGRHYVDGGLLGALPLWTCGPLGVTRVIALNVLTTLPFRLMRGILPVQSKAPMPVTFIEPSVPLGSLHDAVTWSRGRIERWIELGERDGNHAVNSITV